MVCSGTLLPKVQKVLFLLHQLRMKLEQGWLVVLIISKINGPDGNIGGAGMECEGAGVVIGNKLDNNQSPPIIILKAFRDLLSFPRMIYTTACAWPMSKPNPHTTNILPVDQSQDPSKRKIMWSPNCFHLFPY